MNDTTLIEVAHRTSRAANRIAAFGALLMIGAFAVALWQLGSLERQVAEHKRQLASLNEQLMRAKGEKDKLLFDNAELRRQRLQIKRTNQELEEAVKLQQNRDYLTSWRKLNDLLQKDPENEVACYSAAHACYQLGSYTQCVYYASRALTIDTNYFDPYVPLICGLEKIGKRAEALRLLNNIIKQNIDNYGAFITRKRYFDELWEIKEYRDAFILNQRKLMEIQSALRELGLYTGTECRIDGIVGKHTREAVAQFFLSRNLTNNLSVDALADLLNSARK